MKINSLYISAFGGIKNLKLDLEKGFNIIYGENENGKSTVMAFIKMMFYGNERGSSQISKNVRKKYTPWDGSQMAGSIDFEHEGKLYRLEREFKTSNSTDKVTLCDLDLGTRQIVGADIGAKFFGLSCAAFERSVFIGQLGFPENDEQAVGEINSKLSNIVLTGDEAVSFEAVYKRLEKAKLALISKSGRAGEYDKNAKLYTELTARLERAKGAYQTYQTNRSQFAQKENEINLLQKSALALKQKLDAEQDVRNAEKLKKYLELKAELDKANELLKLEDGTLIDEMYLRKLQFCISKVQSAENKAESKRNEISTLKKSLEIGLNPPENATQETADSLAKEIEQLELRLGQIEKEARLLEMQESENSKQVTYKNKKGLKVFLSVFAAICAVAAVFSAIKLWFVPLAVAIALIAVVGVFFGVDASAKKKVFATELKINGIIAKKQELDVEMLRLNSDLQSKKSSLLVINTALQSSAAMVEKQQQMLEAALAELDELQKAKHTEMQALLNLFGLYKTAQELDEILNSIDEISQKAAKQKEIKQQINFISKDLGGISYGEAAKKLNEMGNLGGNSDDFDSLREKYEEITKQIVDLKSQLAASIAENKALVSSIENPNELESSMKELREKLASQKEFCDTVDIAMQVLTQSFAEIRRSYSSVLENKATEIFAGLTANKYESVNISKNLDINVSETGIFGSREIDYLSSGTADQAYLSLRMALAQLVGQNSGTLPLLLDDALTQYDDARMKAALEYLSKYSEGAQIVLFTCHNSVSDAAQGLRANVLSLLK